MNNDFSYYLKQFFQAYLPETRRMSSKTIKTYKYCFIKLFNFFKQEKNIKSDNITLGMFNIEIIEEFINWLHNHENNSASTINNRMATIKCFFRFISIHNVEFLNLYSILKNMKQLRKSEKLIDYLSVDEIRLLFSIPNLQNKKELKELAILTLLYESAIRVGELCDLKVQNIEISNHSAIKIINGKGNKSRIVPISNDVALIFQKYITIYNLNEQAFLFTNQKNMQYTRWGINYIIQKYVNKCKKIDNEKFKIKVTPHIFRHSKAMHLLDAEIPLTTIEKLLGHSSIKSTEIYAKANPKKVEEAIEQNSQSIKVKRKYSKSKENKLLEWLKNEL